jgi:CheY-like chemotaxis protein
MIDLGQDTGRGTGVSGKGGSAGTESKRRRLRFLVVDDDALNRDMMQLMLAPLDHQLDFAGDGTEALEAIKSQPYDLVFLDLILPDMSGREVCRLVREWEAGKRRVPIVAVTAYDLPGQPLEMIKAGMDDYIFKPYDLRGLSRIIELYAGEDSHQQALDGDAANQLPDPNIPILDWKGSLQDFSNDVDGYKGLLTDFLASLPGRLEKILDAQGAGNLAQLDRECHTLKGVSAGLGARRLSRLAAQVGRACNSGKSTAIASLVQLLQQAMAELKAEGDAFLRS